MPAARSVQRRYCCLAIVAVYARATCSEFKSVHFSSSDFFFFLPLHRRLSVRSNHVLLSPSRHPLADCCQRNSIASYSLLRTSPPLLAGSAPNPPLALSSAFYRRPAVPCRPRERFTADSRCSRHPGGRSLSLTPWSSAAQTFSERLSQVSEYTDPDVPSIAHCMQ